MRSLLAVTALLLLSITVAQQPVTSPIYYLSTAPRLEAGVPLTGVLDERSGRNFKDGSYLDVLTLRGEAGEYVELLASSRAFDAYLTLFAPDGSLVDDNDDDPLGSSTDAAVRTTLPATGTYVVVVSGFSPWDLGPYTVTLSSREHAAAGHGTAIEVPSLTHGKLAHGDDGSRFAFVLEETAAIGIEVRSTQFDTTLEVIDEFGDSLAYNDDAPATNGSTTDSALALLLGPGRYQLVVQSYFTGSVGDGSFELEVVRLTPER